MSKNIYEPAGVVEGGSAVLPLLAVLIMSLVLAYIYPKGYEGGTPIAEGSRLGLIMGIFFGVPFALFFSMMFNIALGPMIVLMLVSILEIITMGLLIGLTYGDLKATE